MIGWYLFIYPVYIVVGSGNFFNNFFHPPLQCSNSFRLAPIMYSNVLAFSLKRDDYFFGATPLKRGPNLFGPPSLVCWDTKFSTGVRLSKRYPLGAYQPSRVIPMHECSTGEYLPGLHSCIMPTLWDCINPVGSSQCMNAALASTRQGCIHASRVVII